MNHFSDYEEFFESLDFEICDLQEKLNSIIKYSIGTEIIILLSIPLSAIFPVTPLFLKNLIIWGTILNTSCNLINYTITLTKYIKIRKNFYKELESFKVFLKSNQLKNHNYEEELDNKLPYDDIAVNIEKIIEDFNDMLRKNKEARELNLHPEKAIEENLPLKDIFGEKFLMEHIKDCIKEEDLDDELIPVDGNNKKLNLKKNH